MDELVSTAWLAGELGAPDLKLLDASFHLPGSGRDARSDFLAAHLPGARLLDLDALADRDHPAPHMLPPPEQFASALGALGVASTDRIIVYDDSPLHTAARGWFLLRHFGAGQVAILDGGMAKWRAEGRPVESGDPAAAVPARFDAAVRPGEMVDKQQLFARLGSALLDARSPARFEGREPEPRAGVEPGHIPGARNLPFASLHAEDGTFKRGEELREAFLAAGHDPERPFVATCGSGVTACSLIFAARLLGNDGALLYDGSWAEWGADPSTPKALGAA